MIHANRSRRWIGRSLLGIVVLIGIYLIIGALVSAHYKKLVFDHLPALAAKATDSLYDITVEDLSVNILTRSVTVKGLRMRVNLEQLAHRKAEGRPAKVIFDVSVPEAVVSGVQWRDLKKEKELSCRKVVFRNPVIRIQVMPWWRRHFGRSPHPAPMVSRVFAKHIRIENPHLDIRYSYGEDGFIVQANGGIVSAEDWDFHPRKRFDSTRFFAARTVNLNLKDLSYSKPEAIYRYHLGSIGFDSRKAMVRLQNLSIHPAFPYDTIYAQLGHRKALLHFQLPLLRLEGLQWKRLLASEHVLIADHLMLDTPQLVVFASKRPPEDPEAPPSLFPNQRLQHFVLPVQISLVTIWGGSVEYQEKQALTGAVGSIHFNYLRGGIVNVTNMPEVVQRHPEAMLWLDGSFAYRAPLNVRMRFRLNSEKGGFSVAAVVHGLIAGDLHDAVEAIANVNLKSLNLPIARINIVGNEDSLWGKVSVAYSQLRLRLKKWNAEDSVLRARPLLNFLANNLLLYEANPMPGDSLRVATIGLARGRYRSLFQFVWKGIAQGCLETAIRKGPAYEMAMRRKEAKAHPHQKFFKGLFPKRNDSDARGRLTK